MVHEVLGPGHRSELAVFREQALKLLLSVPFGMAVYTLHLVATGSSQDLTAKPHPNNI